MGARQRYETNMALPIHQLPTECLAKIFHENVPLTEDGHEWPEDQFHPHWLYLRNVVLVCHHWQETVYLFPTLWTHISPSTLTPTTFSRNLKRSGSAPIDMLLSENVSFEIMTISAREISRIRSLFIHSNKNLPAPILDSLKLFSGLAPKLTVLYIGTNVWLGALEDAKPLPPCFPGQLVSLHRLHLSYVPEWSLGSFTNLRILQLFCVGRQAEADALERILAILRANPMLEELSLKRTLPKGVQCSPPLAPSLVRLDNLKRFTLDLFEDSFTGRSLLSHLVLPSSVRARIESEWTTTHLFPLDTTLLGTFYSPSHINISQWTQGESLYLDLDPEARTSDAMLSCKIQVLPQASPNPLIDLLEALKPFNMSNVETLEMSYLDYRDPDDEMKEMWTTIFRRLPSLKTLRFGSTYEACAVLDGLLPTATGLPCPLLHSIYIGKDFRYSRAIPNLLAMLAARHKSGRPISMLEVKNSLGDMEVQRTASMYVEKFFLNIDKPRQLYRRNS